MKQVMYHVSVGDDASAQRFGLRDLGQLLSAVDAAARPAVERVVSAIVALREPLAAVALRLPEIAASLQLRDELFRQWEQEAPSIVKRTVGAHGLIVPTSQMTYRDLVELLAVHRGRGDAALVERVREHYDEIFGCADFLTNLRSTWAEHPHLKRRLPLLMQALRAHELGLFAVSIPTLLAQFEGLVADTMSKVGGMNFAELQQQIEKLGADDRVLGPVLSSFVADALLLHFMHGEPQPPFSRHAILHGGDVGYATEVNSRTAILLIDQFRDFSGSSWQASK